MKSEETVSLLARANPVRERELPDASSAEADALKERILGAAAGLDADAQQETVRRRPRRRRILVATAAVAAFAAVVTLPRALPERHLGASPAAAAVLERAAVASTAYSGSPEGRYAYTKATTLYAGISADNPPFTLLFPSVRETWVAADGSGRVVETRGEPIFPGPRDRRRWQEAGAQRPPRTEIDKLVPARQAVPRSVLSADPKDLTLDQLDVFMNSVPQLPTDPDRLERIVRAYSEKKDTPVEAQMFNQVSSLVHSPAASAELRAAAYRVLARIEGVELEGERRDALGRLGTAISAPAGYGGRDAAFNQNERRRLIIEPSTGNVLAEETVLVQRVEWIDGSPGGVTGSIVILEQGWRDSLDELP